MPAVTRIASFAIGIIGAADLLIINILISLFGSVQRITGADPKTHGWIGLLLFLAALAGSILSLFTPRVGGVLLLIAGIGFFFVAHWWALLASPQLLIGGVLPFLARRGETPRFFHADSGPPAPAQ
jgi:hypothetical protein